jgi:heat shock protein HtpX
MAITFAARMAFWFGDDDNFIAGLLMMILAPIAAVLIKMAISRSCEFNADAGGKELVGTGEPLARALHKIDAYARRVPMDVNPAEASNFIINPFTGRRVAFTSLFSTHPPTEERIRRLLSDAPARR